MTTLIHPLLAANAFQFAIEKATTEGKVTIAALLLLSMFSWTIVLIATFAGWSLALFMFGRFRRRVPYWL